MAEISETGLEIAWCPGCGNFGILKAVQKAIADLEIKPKDLLMVSGIGQAGKLPHYVKSNTFNSLHGRPLSPAVAAKITNPALTVIAVSGDGDGYGEGGNHFVHTVRRNHDITYIVHNNQVYGLTKGQASPTSDRGFVTKTTPHGAPEPVHPLMLAIVSGAGFVARGFAGDPDHLAGLIGAGIQHRGFALIDILQPCVSFNHRNTFAWYKERVYDLGDEKGYDPSDRTAALEKAAEWGDRIPVGIIYRQEQPAFEDGLADTVKEGLLLRKLDPGKVKKLIGEFL